LTDEYAAGTVSCLSLDGNRMAVGFCLHTDAFIVEKKLRNGTRSTPRSCRLLMLLLLLLRVTNGANPSPIVVRRRLKSASVGQRQRAARRSRRALNF
jgi:hypothetical protein